MFDFEQLIKVFLEMSRASKCNSNFEDFTDAERGQNCPTCSVYGIHCLGSDHPRQGKFPSFDFIRCSHPVILFIGYFSCAFSR
jgi:hypothetical protein